MTNLMSLMACKGVHKSKRVGGLDTRPERVFITDLSAWLWLTTGLEREHTLDSSLFITNGTGIDCLGDASTAVFSISGLLKVDSGTAVAVEGGEAG